MRLQKLKLEEDEKDGIGRNAEGVQTTEKIMDDSKLPQVNSPFSEITKKTTCDSQQNCVWNIKTVRGWIHKDSQP